MKKLLLSALLAVVPAARGAIPETLGGYVCYTSVPYGHIVGVSATLFSADGTFTGLYSYGGTTPGSYSFGDNPSKGTYTYQRVDESSAILTLAKTRPTAVRR